MKYLPGIFLLTLLILSGCRKDPEEQRLSWSTDSPLSIPLRIRQQRFEKGNLLRNSSFEQGKTLKIDSVKSSFVLDGWKQTGEHVEWVDVRNDSLFKKDEAFSGYRSVKITRAHAKETDKEGEGVISDFVKVIPGNYNFSFFIRLQNVMPQQARLGIKLYDAIDIRILYYDRNRNLIKPDHDFPQTGQSIDNSFKSLSFANYNHIDKFEWGKIIGKSADFPFPDGDVPTNAHFIKIYLGLKGTGTMWIDRVSFSYSLKNFSVSERMMNYTDTSSLMSPVVIPTPQKIKRMQSVQYFRPGHPEVIPLIIIPGHTDELTTNAADLLKKEILRHIRTFVPGHEAVPDIPIVYDTPDEINKRQGLTFVLGGAQHKALQQPSSEIAGHQEGYYIYSTPELPDIVYLGGNNSTGVYYAVLSAIQLLDEKLPVFHNARIIDFPDFENRFYTYASKDEQSPDNHSRAYALSMYKMNGAVYLLQGSYPHELPSVMDIPGFRTGLCDVKGMIYPDVTTLTYPDRIDPIRFSPPEVSENPVLPPFYRTPVLLPAYNNYLLDYMDLFNLPASGGNSLTCLYSGRSYYSTNTDAADIRRYRDYVGKKPVFLDNSMQISGEMGKHYESFPYSAGKARLYNLFQPFNNASMRDLVENLDTSLYWVNLKDRSEIEVIRLATAADFMWNTRDYDPELSLWKVLTSRYGLNTARELVHFADLYALLLEINTKLQNSEQLQRNLKNIPHESSRLMSSLSSIEKLLGTDHPLSRELRAKAIYMTTRLHRYNSSARTNP